MRLRKVLALLTMVLVAVAPGVAAAQGVDENVDGAFVHGIPDQEVDVYVDGLLAFDDVAPFTVEGPVFLQPGSYDIDIRPGDGTSVTTPIVSSTVTVPAGADAVRIVAALDENGRPAIETLLPDRSPTAVAGKGRLLVHHVADAPAIDVLGNGQPLGTDIGPGEDFTGVVSPTDFGLNIRATGTTSPLLATDVRAVVGASQLAEYFVVGSPVGNALAIVPYSTDLIGGVVTGDVDAGGIVRPNNVPTGTGGLVADVSASTGLMIAVMAMAAIGVGMGGYRAVRSTS